MLELEVCRFLIASCKTTETSRDLTELPSDVRNQPVSLDDSQLVRGKRVKVAFIWTFECTKIFKKRSRSNQVPENLKKKKNLKTKVLKKNHKSFRNVTCCKRKSYKTRLNHLFSRSTGLENAAVNQSGGLSASADIVSCSVPSSHPSCPVRNVCQWFFQWQELTRKELLALVQISSFPICWWFQSRPSDSNHSAAFTLFTRCGNRSPYTFLNAVIFSDFLFFLMKKK